MTPITNVDPYYRSDSCSQEPVKLYVGGEGLSPNNFVAKDQSIFKFVSETQPSDRKEPNEENVNVIVHNDFDGITVSDPTVGNVAPCNISFLPPNNRYIPRVNFLSCSSSFNNDNSHSDVNNLLFMEVGDSDGLIGKKLFSSKGEL